MESLFRCRGSGKSSWPELVGEKGHIAAVKVKQENPNVNAIVMCQGSPMTKDFRCDRVRVVVNNQGLIVLTPPHIA